MFSPETPMYPCYNCPFMTDVDEQETDKGEDMSRLGPYHRPGMYPGLYPRPRRPYYPWPHYYPRPYYPWWLYGYPRRPYRPFF